MTQTLTEYQDKLVASLITEFKRLNPQTENKVGGSFSFATIKECIDEEQKFKQSMLAFNTEMGNMLRKLIDEQTAQFLKEYGSAFDIAFGTQYKGDANSEGINGFIKSSINNGYYGFNTLCINIVSKSKTNTNRDRKDYNNGMAYLKLWCEFKTEKNTIHLPSGKQLDLSKISGLTFSRLQRCEKKDDTKVGYSIDNLIQTDKYIQQTLVELYGK